MNKESILCDNLNWITYGDKFNRSKRNEKFKNSRIMKYFNFKYFAAKYCSFTNIEKKIHKEYNAPAAVEWVVKGLSPWLEFVWNVYY